MLKLLRSFFFLEIYKHHFADTCTFSYMEESSLRLTLKLTEPHVNKQPQSLLMSSDSLCLFFAFTAFKVRIKFHVYKLNLYIGIQYLRHFTSPHLMSDV